MPTRTRPNEDVQAVDDLKDGLASLSSGFARVGVAASKVGQLGLETCSRQAKRFARAATPVLKRTARRANAAVKRGLHALDLGLQYTGDFVRVYGAKAIRAAGTAAVRCVLFLAARIDLLSLSVGVALTALLLPRGRSVSGGKDAGRKRGGQHRSGGVPPPALPSEAPAGAAEAAADVPSSPEAAPFVDEVVCEGDSPLVLAALRSGAVQTVASRHPLTSVAYLRAALAAGGLGPLLQDINAWADAKADQEASILAAAMRRCAPGLRLQTPERASDALPTQLGARLAAVHNLPSGLIPLLKECQSHTSPVPRVVLLRPSLDAPGTSPLEVALPASNGDAITALAVLDSSTVATGSRDGRLRLCCTNSVAVLAVGEGHGTGAVITAIAVLHDGRHVTTGATDGTSRTWLLPWAAAEHLHARANDNDDDDEDDEDDLPVAKKPTRSMPRARGGAPGSGSVHLKCVRVMAAGRVAALAALPGGTGARLAVAGDSTDVTIMEAVSGTLEQRVLGHNTRVMALCIVPRWTEANAEALPPCALVSAAADGEVRVWFGVHGPRNRITCVASIQPPGAVPASGPAASTTARANAILQLLPLANGRVVAASMEAVRVWSVQDAIAAWSGRDVDEDESEEPVINPLLTLPSGKLNAVAALPDGRLVLGGDASMRTYAMHGGTFTCTRTLRGRRCATASLLGLSDGRLLAGCVDGVVRLWCGAATSAHAQQQQQQHSDRVSCLAALPGGRCASGSWDGTLRLWSAAGECVKECSGHNARILALVCVQPSEAESLLVSAAPGALRFWRASDGTCLRCAEAPHGRAGVNCLAALQPASACRVASGGDDGLIKIWDLAAGGECMQTHTPPASISMARITCMVAFPVPKSDATQCWLVAGDSDGTLRLWCAATGACLATLGRPHPEGGVSAVTILNDGLAIIAAGEDRTLSVFTATAEGSTSWRAHAPWRSGANDVTRCLVPLSHTSVLAVGGRGACVWDVRTQEGTVVNGVSTEGGAVIGGLSNQLGPQSACVLAAGGDAAATASMFALAVGPSLKLGGSLWGCDSAAACYLDDTVRCCVALSPSGGKQQKGGRDDKRQPGPRVAVGTDGGAVHFVEVAG